MSFLNRFSNIFHDVMNNTTINDVMKTSTIDDVITISKTLNAKVMIFETSENQTDRFCVYF